jgi:hypothetical protein
MTNTPEKYVRLGDISEKQVSLIGLPFGICDDDNKIFSLLYHNVYQHYNDEDDQPWDLLNALQGRYNLVTDNRQQLSRLYERPMEEIHLRHQLTKTIEHERGFCQFLFSDISISLADGPIKYKQPPLVFILGEDMNSWIKTGLVAELPVTTENVPAGTSHASPPV